MEIQSSRLKRAGPSAHVGEQDHGHSMVVFALLKGRKKEGDTT